MGGPAGRGGQKKEKARTRDFRLGLTIVNVELLVEVVGHQADVVVPQPFELQLVGDGCNRGKIENSEKKGSSRHDVSSCGRAVKATSAPT